MFTFATSFSSNFAASTRATFQFSVFSFPFPLALARLQPALFTVVTLATPTSSFL